MCAYVFFFFCVCVCFACLYLRVCVPFCAFFFFSCVRSSVRLHALDNDIYELCMWCDAFHSISALIFPQTTLQRRVSGHLAVNKLELIDFNSGQHPSAKHSPGSELNKLPPGTVLRSALVHYFWLSRARARLRKTDLKSAFIGQLFLWSPPPQKKEEKKNEKQEKKHRIWGAKLTKAGILWIFTRIY